MIDDAKVAAEKAMAMVGITCLVLWLISAAVMWLASSESTQEKMDLLFTLARYLPEGAYRQRRRSAEGGRRDIP